MVWKKKVRKDYIFQGDIEHFGIKTGGIHVDWFDFTSVKSLYFLSHAHSDHFSFEDDPNIIGLLTKTFIKQLQKGPHIKIYCTTTTWEIIIKLPKAKAVVEELEKLKEKNFVLVEPDIENSITIDLFFKNGNKSKKTIDVTVIPANHIPGAVMFLFEDKKENKRALYTGDFRYDVREKNNEMTALREFVKSYKKVIDYLYVDITCLDLGRLYHPDQNQFPSRQESKVMVCNLIEKYKPKNVHIDAELLGAEDMVKAVAESFSNTADDIISRLDEGCLRKELYEYTLQGIKKTIVQTEVHIHIHDKSIFNFTSVCRKCEEDKDTLKIRATLKWIFGRSYSKNYSYGTQDTWKNVRDDRNFWQVLYSHHSSDCELREFISHLKFKEVFPISECFSREYFKGIKYKDVTGPEIKKKHHHIKKSLYFSLESASMKYNNKSAKVLWLTGNSDSIARESLSDDKFQVTERYFRDYDNILSEVKKYSQSIEFLIIPCTRKLKKSLEKNGYDLSRFIDNLTEAIATKNVDEAISTVIFYSTTNDMDDEWEQIIKKVPRLFYIDLTEVPEYTDSDTPLILESSIILETLKNLIRNEDKEVDVSDWPMPYKFSERKREHDQENDEENQLAGLPGLISTLNINDDKSINRGLTEE